jgi:hypothetical protein
MRSRLGYLHMPKAAGTSIRAAFAAYYDAADIVPYSFDRHLFGDDPRIDEISEPLFLGTPEQLAGYRYMEGHWALPTMAAVFAPDDIVCVLREPRARFLSHYTFWRGWPDSMHELWEPYEAAKHAQLALSEYCREPAIAHQADNLVTRLLLGPHPLVPNHAHIAASDIDTVADEACRRLDELGYVDVLERGDDVYRDLEAWFGSPLTRERLNETDLAFGPPVDLTDLADPATLALVDDRNASDLRIWLHVADRRGLDPRAARSLADSAFGAAIVKVAIAHAQPAPRDPSARHPLDRAPIEQTPIEQAGVDPERPSAPARLVRLVRRGPGAVKDRIVAELERRRNVAPPEA